MMGKNCRVDKDGPATTFDCWWCYWLKEMNEGIFLFDYNNIWLTADLVSKWLWTHCPPTQIHLCSSAYKLCLSRCIVNLKHNRMFSQSSLSEMIWIIQSVELLCTLAACSSWKAAPNFTLQNTKSWWMMSRWPSFIYSLIWLRHDFQFNKNICYVMTFSVCIGSDLQHLVWSMMSLKFIFTNKL